MKINKLFYLIIIISTLAIICNAADNFGNSEKKNNLILMTTQVSKLKEINKKMSISIANGISEKEKDEFVLVLNQLLDTIYKEKFINRNKDADEKIYKELWVEARNNIPESIKYLAKMKDYSTIPIFLKATANFDPEIGIGYVPAIFGEESVSHLINYAKSNDQPIAQEAILILRFWINPPYHEECEDCDTSSWPKLSDKSKKMIRKLFWDLRDITGISEFSIIGGLAAFDDPEIIEFLEKQSKENPKEYIREEAKKQLERIKESLNKK